MSKYFKVLNQANRLIEYVSSLTNMPSKWPGRPDLNLEISDYLNPILEYDDMGRASPLLFLALFQSHQEESYTCL